MSTQADPSHYGVDPHADDLAAQIDAAIRAHTPPGTGGQVHWVYALIDGSIHHELGAEMLERSRQPRAAVCSIYAGTALEAGERYGPFLWRMYRQQLDALLARCDGQPAISFIQSPLALDALQCHLAAFILARTPDGLALALRIADPMVLRAVVQALGAQAEAQLCTGFAAWHLIGRDGHLQTWAGTADTQAQPVPLPDQPWPMSDKAFKALVRATEADEVLCAAQRELRLPPGQHSATALYSRVAALLAVMDSRHKHDPAERRRLVTQALRNPNALAAELWLKEQAGELREFWN